MTNAFPGEGGAFSLSLLRLAFLPIDEKNPPVDLLADIGSDFIEDGGDMNVEFCVKLRVMGARDG